MRAPEPDGLSASRRGRPPSGDPRRRRTRAGKPTPSWRRSSSPRSTSSPTTPSATPRSTLGSARRSPSWCDATASRTSAGPSGASRSTSCRRRPGRSTRSPSTRPTSPAAGSPSCRSTLIGGLGRAVVLAVRSIYRVVDEILHPQVDQDRTVPSDTYWAALRKIHRMRKPVFMGSLWLRARFDVEYLGLPLPTAPPGIAAESLMETDLDYIGATRQDRIIAEQVRRQHQERLEWVARWLDRFGWTFDELPRLPRPGDPLPGQSRRRGAAGPRGRVRPRPRRHRHARPVDRGPEAGPGLCRRSVAGPRRRSPPDSPSRSSTSGRSGIRCIAAGAGRRPVRSPVLPRLRRGPAAADPPLPAPASPRRPRLDQGRPRPGRRRPLGDRQDPDARRPAPHRPLERPDPGPPGRPDA